jgi:nicotinamide-nucleotide amidase
MIAESVDESLESLAVRLGEMLTMRGFMLATAESCTGGWVAKTVTDVPGSSGWFDRGFVTYSNAAKQDMLGVTLETLSAYGAVSQPVIEEMVTGALRYSAAQVAIAVSGIAGPGGGGPDKPVGTVWVGWGLPGVRAIARRYCFDGNREAVRAAAVRAVIEGLLEHLTADG